MTDVGQHGEFEIFNEAVIYFGSVVEHNHVSPEDALLDPSCSEAYENMSDVVERYPEITKVYNDVIALPLPDARSVIDFVKSMIHARRFVDEQGHISANDTTVPDVISDEEVIQEAQIFF